MKKITLIASLLIVFTACQKADIRPRTVSPASSQELKSNSSQDTPNPNSGNPNTLGGGSDSSVDPNTPDPNGGDITDPLRKKDQKDNK
ncbi:hypothetical protein [Fluviicola sp.]|jgi:hypothetical protein|uniref:hypothetical protein n=1 Tax=Fluviicola sp. TaxID=1917219 RepID=UPI00261F46A4|nr:hypothetical protein [Fluviicola sp.]